MMSKSKMLSEMSDLIERNSRRNDISSTFHPSLHLINIQHSGFLLPDVYSPAACFSVFGNKDVLIHDRVYVFSPLEYMVVPVDMPLSTRIIDAPFLGFKVELDMAIISEMADAITSDGGYAGSLILGRMDDDLASCSLRLLRLLENEADVRYLAPLILRELFYRLLKTENGNLIAQAVASGSRISNINSAIKIIRENYLDNLDFTRIADSVSMGKSSFYNHFKTITSMSPLQYQKKLRLIEARNIMLSESVDAASAAYRVGYESSSQFSREYSRMFGSPPGRDIAAIKRAIAI